MLTNWGLRRLPFAQNVHQNFAVQAADLSNDPERMFTTENAAELEEMKMQRNDCKTAISL